MRRALGWINRLSGSRLRRPLGVLLLAIALSVAVAGWARSPWAGVWPYRIGLPDVLDGAGPCADVRGQEVILRLRPGGCGPVTLTQPVPGDIPPGEVVLRVPRYPGAEPTDNTISANVLSMSLDGYLKEASAMFLVPTGNPTTIESWYAGKMPALGYITACCGTNSNGTDSITDTVTSEAFYQDLSLRGRVVQINSEGTEQGGALLLIEAHLTTPPSRPTDSLVPPDVASLTIEYRSAYDLAQTRQWEQQAQQTIMERPWRRVVRDGPTLRRLASMLNGMPVNTGISGGVQDPRLLTLTFRTHDRRSLVFTWAGCCAGIHGPDAVLDYSGTGFENAIFALAPQH